jgi:hypothetical protein
MSDIASIRQLEKEKITHPQAEGKINPLPL